MQLGRSSVQTNALRVKQDKCEICNQGFNLMHKQHECKRCMKAVCWNCSQEKQIIPQYDPNTAHRICKTCKDERLQMNQKRDKEKCQFGSLSSIGSRWLNIIKEGNQSVKQYQQEYQELKEKLNKNSSDEIKSLLQQYLLRTYKEIKTNMNYSLFDWHTGCTLKENDNSIFLAISNVLTAFYQTKPIKLNQALIMITLFLLYFCDEATTLQMLLYLHQQVIPTKFQYSNIDVDKPVENEVDLLINIYEDQYKFDQAQIKNYVKKFFQLYSTPMLSTLMINHLTFNAIFFLIDYLIIHNDFLLLENMVALIAKLQIQQIQETNNLNSQQFKNQILQKVDVSQLQTFFMNFEMGRQQRLSISKSNNETVLSRNHSVMVQPEDTNQLILDTIKDIVNNGASNRVDNVLEKLKSEETKLAFNDLVFSLRKKKEKYEDVIKEYQQLQDYKARYEQMEKMNFTTQLTSNFDSEAQDKEVAQDNKQNKEYAQDNKQTPAIQVKTPTYENDVDSQNQQSSLENREIPASRSDSRVDQSEFVLELQRELQQVRNENVELINSLRTHRQSLMEQGTIQQQYNEYLENTRRYKVERQAFQMKMKEMQSTIQSQVSDIQSKEKEIVQCNKEIEEIKKHSLELAVMKEEQNHQIKILKQHVDELKSQVDGFKRKGTSELSDQQKLELTLSQLRNELINKEQDLYVQKFQFVGINQQKIKIREQISELEKENKQLKQKLNNHEQNYEKSDIKKVTEYYEEKIELLQQNHQEQMNRLLGQQSNVQQEPSGTQELIQQQQEDDCRIF